MFASELSMKKWIKKNWVAGFSVIPAIIAFGFSNCLPFEFVSPNLDCARDPFHIWFEISLAQYHMFED